MHDPAATDVHAMMVVSTTRSSQVGAESRFLLESESAPPVLRFSPRHERDQQ
jgi:hypothetical protein